MNLLFLIELFKTKHGLDKSTGENELWISEDSEESKDEESLDTEIGDVHWSDMMEHVVE